MFNIDFLKKTSGLIKESFNFKKFKKMPLAFAIIIGILMSPLIFISLILSLELICFTFLFKVLQKPIDHVHNLLKNEAKDVKHATQFIIYFISWPFVFIFYAFTGLLTIIIHFEYALLSIINYAWTLGGFKFHVFIDENDDISVDVDSSYKLMPLIIFIVIMGIILVIVPVIYNVIDYLILYYNWSETYFIIYYPFFIIPIAILFEIVYSYLVLSTRPIEEKKEINYLENE